MEETKVSRRGVYKDLSLSPYEYVNPYGDIFKFPSQKKLEIYARDVSKEIEKVSKFLSTSGLADYLPGEIVQMLYRYTYRSFYRKREV